MRLYKKEYLRMRIQITSPLSIGSGNNLTTDHDILRDSRGIPFIPGTAIAGITRHALLDMRLEDSGYQKIDRKYFGNVSISNGLSGESGDASESRIIFYDAFPENTQKKLFLTVRDQVRLDEYKTAVKGAKFDMEVLEPGIIFSAVISQNFEEGDKNLLNEIAGIWSSGKAFLGSKTTRGYGAVRVLQAEKAEFDFTRAKEIDGWLNFDPFGQSTYWKQLDIPNMSFENSNEKLLRISLKQAPGSGLSIRKYSTKPSKEDIEPDYEQLTTHIVENGRGIEKPVIPGTTWAGAFRSHMQKIGKLTGKNTDELSRYFGSVNEKRKRKSRICFSESILDGSVMKVFSRNAIDRFTGGASDKALYTEKTCYGGTTVLSIRWRIVEDSFNDDFIELLADAVADLDAGILSVGGETSIGRGIFQVTAINGQKADNPEQIFKIIKGILEKGPSAYA